MLGVPDRGGKELGGEKVGNGEGGGDEELAGHGQGKYDPHLCHHGGTWRPRQKSSLHKNERNCVAQKLYELYRRQPKNAVS